MLEKRPIKPLLYNNGFWGPKGSHIYYVKDGDDWERLAKADGWPTVWEFIHYNFKTYDPEEVNWYLHRFVGCTKTDDGMNYSFSSKDRIRMSDGTSQRGHIFTRKQIFTKARPETRHEKAKKAVIDTLDQYKHLMSSIRFTMYGYKFRGTEMTKIRDHVEQNRILVAHRPGLRSAGTYYPYFDAMHLRDNSRLSGGDRAVIMHECTHAIMDMQAVTVSRHVSEAIAFVVQCVIASYEGLALYTADRVHNSRTDECSGHEDCKFAIADQIAMKIRRGVTDVSTHDQNRMMKAMKEDPHYGHKHGTPEYNGIKKRTINPLPPVIPYGA